MQYLLWQIFHIISVVTKTKNGAQRAVQSQTSHAKWKMVQIKMCQMRMPFVSKNQQN